MEIQPQSSGPILVIIKDNYITNKISNTKSISSLNGKAGSAKLWNFGLSLIGKGFL
ncbi:MAG TPA: hypothetical protein VLB84_12105 [Bacteroidia bacterium]|nr:hypothetical protein [Bacteroidia bacterium]